MIEIRSSEDGENWTLSGLATTYGTPYPVRDHSGEYLETIARGAFANATAGGVVELRVEHQHGGPPLAATGRSQTMTLTDATEGLVLRATLPKDDPEAQSAVSKAKRGLLDRMSVGFSSAQSDWNSDRSQRTVRSAKLVEVSLVHRPANPGAMLTAVRAESGDGQLEIRIGSEIAVIDGREGSTKTPRSVPSFEELELELRALEYTSSGRKVDLRQSAQLASPDARLARAVAASRRAELEFELLRRR